MLQSVKPPIFTIINSIVILKLFSINEEDEDYEGPSFSFMLVYGKVESLLSSLSVVYLRCQLLVEERGELRHENLV